MPARGGVFKAHQNLSIFSLANVGGWLAALSECFIMGFLFRLILFIQPSQICTEHRGKHPGRIECARRTRTGVKVVQQAGQLTAPPAPLGKGREKVPYTVA